MGDVSAIRTGRLGKLCHHRVGIHLLVRIADLLCPKASSNEQEQGGASSETNSWREVWMGLYWLKRAVRWFDMSEQEVGGSNEYMCG